MAEKFYLTTPIFYPNAKLHMGHAYTTTLSDIFVRYERLTGRETYFLTGSDENTQKMIDAARAAGEEPLEFLDEIVAKFKELFDEFGEIEEATVITDKYSGRSKGFGFVTFVNDADADKAVAAMNEKDIEGRPLKVNEAKPKEE